MRKHRQARARDARAKTGARARCARRARELCARAHFGHARAQISSPKVDLVSLFSIWRAYLRARRAYLRARVSDGRAREHARASWPCLRTSRAPLFARASRARACRCSRTSRAHVLNARALALRTPQLVRHHMWIHMFWIKPNYDS